MVKIKNELNLKNWFKKNYKKGQITIWIILAVFLLASVILFLLLGRETEIIIPPTSEMINVPSFIDRCTAQYVHEAVELMLPQGGFLSPKNSVYYDKTNIEFLCENSNFDEPCINQHPMLIKEIETQLEDYLDGKINSCFSELREEIESSRGEILFDEMAVDVELGEDKISVSIEADVEVAKRDVKKKYDKFDIEVASGAYNLAEIAREIAGQESKYCFFEPIGYSLNYPRYDVSRYVMSEPIKIYTIIDTKTGEKMNIAIRSCAIPLGI